LASLREISLRLRVLAVKIIFIKLGDLGGFA